MVVRYLMSGEYECRANIVALTGSSYVLIGACDQFRS